VAFNAPVAIERLKPPWVQNPGGVFSGVTVSVVGSVSVAVVILTHRCGGPLWLEAGSYGAPGWQVDTLKSRAILGLKNITDVAPPETAAFTNNSCNPKKHLTSKRHLPKLN